MSVFRQNFGVHVIAVWSAVLGVLNLLRLFYTSGIGFSRLEVQAPLAQIHLYQWVSLAFSAAFLAAAAGLWTMRNWGRYLFLITALPFFLVSLAGLFVAQTESLSALARWWLGGRYVLSVALPLIYLNLPFVEKLFSAKS